jgi:hypothetical protein
MSTLLPQAEKRQIAARASIVLLFHLGLIFALRAKIKPRRMIAMFTLLNKEQPYHLVTAAAAAALHNSG